MEPTAQAPMHPSSIPAVPQPLKPPSIKKPFDWSRVAVYLLILLFFVSFGFAFYVNQTPQSQEPAVHPIKITPTISHAPIATSDAVLQILSHLQPIMENDQWGSLKRDTFIYVSLSPQVTATLSGYSIHVQGQVASPQAMMQQVRAYKGISIDLTSWQDDINQDAGGPLGNQYGFKRFVNEKEQVLIIGYGMKLAQFGPDIEPQCPCSYNYHIFYSDPFDPVTFKQSSSFPPATSSAQ